MAEYSKERASIFEPFIRYRVASNNWNEVYSQTLLYFDRFCSENYPGVKGITQEMINGWCIQRPTEQKRSFIDRCQSALRLIEYLQNRNLISVVKPEMPPAPPKTHIPHAFSEEELCRFFSRCDENVKTARDQSSRFIALSVSVEFRLLYSSGMRPTETRLLRTENVDLARGIINVKETKGNQQHYVALHDDAIRLLRDYDAVASKRFPSRIIFFPMNSKNPDIPISPDMLDYHFHKVWDKVNGSSAVPYDFRHNYAIENINSWINSGFEFHDKLVFLSKSMGHTSLESTKYYYSIVPALADILQKTTGAGFDEIVPEVPDYE